MRNSIHFASFFLLLFSAASGMASSLKLIGQQAPKEGGGEIISYTADGHCVASTFSGGKDGHGVQLFTLQKDGSLQERKVVEVGSLFNGEIFSVTSVALDPKGRGLGAVAVIPKDNSSLKGRLILFSYVTGEKLGEGLEVGFHPDCVNFSQDGNYLLVANEGEFSPAGSAPGSLTVIDLTEFKTANVESVAKLVAADHDFQNCDLSGARIHEPNVPVWQAVEPEYVTSVADKAYVTLQENNAIAVFDLVKGQWEAIHSLGTLKQSIDANPADKGADISQPFAGMPMPDTLTAFQHQGATFLATANEGDARPDDFDIGTVATAKLNDSIAAWASDEKVKRLEISNLDGDTDKDGDIDEPVMFGTRSFSLWNGQTGKLVYDSGSLEPLLLKQDATLHNIDSGTAKNFDKRSAKKGPEPEALAIGYIDQQRFLFVGLERQNGILMFDVTVPEAPMFAAYVNTIAEKLVAPESLVFVPTASSPSGKPLLLGGFELNGGGIGVFEVEP